MKKISLIIALSLFAGFSAQTQFGVKAGYINSNINWQSSPSNFWEDYSDFSSQSFFYAGGFALQPVTEKFSVQGELIYTQLGGTTKVNLHQLVGSEIIDIGTANIKYSYQQLQVPIAAKYHIIKNFGVLGGFNFAFNINSKVSSDFSSFPNSGKVENKKTLDIFPFVGTEFHFNKNIFAEARYNFGISNMHENGIDVRANFFQIGLGYRFK